MSEPERHHYEPQVLLDRFADDGLLVARRRDGRTLSTGARNVAVETGFYDIHPEDGSTSKAVDRALADVEGATANVMHAIDLSGEPPAPDTAQREALATGPFSIGV